MKKEEEILSRITGYSIQELHERLTEPILQPYDCLMAMDEYAQQQVNILNIPAVSNNKVAVCPHKHIMWINSYWKYFCLECGKTGIESN